MKLFVMKPPERREIFISLPAFKHFQNSIEPFFKRVCSPTHTHTHVCVYIYIYIYTTR